MVEAYVAEGARDWGVSRYSCAEGRLDAALAQAQTLPMMCSTQVVFLEEVEALESMPDKPREAAVDSLAAYLKNPAPFTVLVLEAATLDQRMRLSKLLLEGTLAVDVGLSDDPASRREMAVAIAKSMAKELGAVFESGAAEVAEAGGAIAGISVEQMAGVSEEVQTACSLVTGGPVAG